MASSFRLVPVLLVSFASLASAGILDTVPGATAGYSLRRLDDDYAGSAITVRRSSDNSTTSIGFDGSGNLDTAALLSFVGAGDGFVTTWFDQSGNANNVTQATAGKQPQIVASGALITSNNGATALRFEGDNSTGNAAGDSLAISGDLYGTAATIITSGAFDTDPASPQLVQRFWTFNSDDSTRLALGGDDSLLAVAYRNGTSFTDSNTSFDPVMGQTFIGSLVADAAPTGSNDTLDVYANGMSVLDLNGRNLGTDVDEFAIGALNAAGTRGLIGTINELIFYSSVLSESDRMLVENSMSAAYVPEPSSAVLLLCGGLGLAVIARRRYTK